MPIEIMVEQKTADELSALSAYDLGVALNEVLEAIATCGRLTRGARDRIMNAKLKAMRSELSGDILDAKCDRIVAETELAHVRDRASALRLQASILQSLLRAANIT